MSISEDWMDARSFNTRQSHRTPSIPTQDASIHGGGTTIYQRIQNGFGKSYIWIPRSKQCSSSLKKMQILLREAA
ncbi:hypothetical protein IFM89_027447 [Coptis chinensis]|uniref:Uncharacterized protein n=1 Tax=Coptis chinensis TaxID=261450 RepID=A0A835J2E0_9MAGN|nr:hypothetical protein IFM89_027447 [Coptis chinensis]